MDVHVTFTLPQLLSFIGLGQIVFLLTYILFRTRSLLAALLPAGYFAVLGLAFFLDFAAPYWSGLDILPLLQWTAWLIGPPLSVLVILQIAGGFKALAWYHYIGPVCFLTLAAASMAMFSGRCAPPGCEGAKNLLLLGGVVIGLLDFASLWPQRETIRACKALDMERYWLVVTLIVVNLWLLSMILLLGLNPATATTLVIVRPIVGITLIYIATTSLLRIYPQAIVLKAPLPKASVLTPQEANVAAKLRDLIETQKIYQEPDCSRSMIARELSISESSVSRIIGKEYDCTFPRLISERRIQDARQLLRETAAPAKVIAADAGFSSLASFNRVFREITGQSPSEYRASSKNEA